MHQKLFQFFLTKEAEVLEITWKRNCKGHAQNLKNKYVNTYREYLVWLQSNASSSFLETCQFCRTRTQIFTLWRCFKMIIFIIKQNDINKRSKFFEAYFLKSIFGMFIWMYYITYVKITFNYSKLRN